ncbi:MAG: type II 3-dehydroquinate dehydratase [Gammaproteobacteria bacterium]|nr:type II 3-dehydroquinate dehydratase [Gammaproteobacteria bacterium]MCZ6724124.1 type II 3-dehydroquinate dehydratase [Gammaproteobacteria bacterium]MCZ6882659.1 type II 3-dehydroquinate dehydratase [Gammaproteobacteria bacterium]
MIKILVIHGPNLNMLGSREPEVYGSDTLASIDASIAEMAKSKNVSLETFQSNLEGEIVDRIQQAAADQTQIIIINPAAFTHTSIAIRDAFLASSVPFIEVHLSNVHAREDFRKHSYLSDIASGVISGFGKNSYLLAFEAAVNQCNQSNS